MNIIKELLKRWAIAIGKENKDQVITAHEYINQRLKYQKMLDSAQHDNKRLKRELMVTRVKLTKARNKLKKL